MTGTIKITTAGKRPILLSTERFTSTKELRKMLYYLKGKECVVRVMFNEDLIKAIEDNLNEMEGEYENTNSLRGKPNGM